MKFLLFAKIFVFLAVFHFFVLNFIIFSKIIYWQNFKTILQYMMYIICSTGTKFRKIPYNFHQSSFVQYASGSFRFQTISGSGFQKNNCRSTTLLVVPATYCTSAVSVMEIQYRVYRIRRRKEIFQFKEDPFSIHVRVHYHLTGKQGCQ